MTNLLTHFDRDKTELGKRIADTASIEEALKLTDDYLIKLHGDVAGACSLQKSRAAGNLLEILRYAVRSVNTVDKDMGPDGFGKFRPQAGRASNRFFVFGKTVQAALVLALLMSLLSVSPAPGLPILLVLIVLATEIYLQLFARQGSAARNAPAFHPPDEPPKIDAPLKIARVHAFLSCIADALSWADKAMNEQAPGEAGGAFETETQFLRLFQDLFEARAFHDGEWALKKISHIQAMLYERGIVVKEFDPGDSADAACFDVEPGADPSIRHHITIRPAFIREKRVLLRGRAAAPFSAANGA